MWTYDCFEKVSIEDDMYVLSPRIRLFASECWVVEIEGLNKLKLLSKLVVNVIVFVVSYY